MQDFNRWSSPLLLISKFLDRCNQLSNSSLPESIHSIHLSFSRLSKLLRPTSRFSIFRRLRIRTSLS